MARTVRREHRAAHRGTRALNRPGFTRRMNRHLVPQRGVLRLNHPSGCRLQPIRETLELPSDAQQLVVLLPADEKTSQAVDQLRHRPQGRLRAISQHTRRIRRHRGAVKVLIALLCEGHRHFVLDLCSVPFLGSACLGPEVHHPAAGVPADNGRSPRPGRPRKPTGRCTPTRSRSTPPWSGTGLREAARALISGRG